MTQSCGPTSPILRWHGAVGCYRAIGQRGSYSILKSGSLWNCYYYCDNAGDRKICDEECHGHRIFPGYYRSQYDLRKVIEEYDADATRTSVLKVIS